MPRRLAIALALAALTAAPAPARAFCGFYVGGADQKLFNNATMVVLMREGARTVLSMQNNYQGPPDAFAMVVPVPIVLQKVRWTRPRLTGVVETRSSSGHRGAAEASGRREGGAAAAPGDGGARQGAASGDDAQGSCSPAPRDGGAAEGGRRGFGC